MPKDNHILFLVPDGVGIKNYLYSEIITHIKHKAKITIWSTLPLEAFEDVKKLHQIEFGYKQIKLQPESVLTRLFREASTYARLKHNAKLKDNPTILMNWRKPNYNLKVKLLYKLAEVLGDYITSNYSRILKFEAKYRRHIPSKIISSYKKDLEGLSPNSIFITHQRVPGIMPICMAAQRLGIKTTTAIFSWDNLPKARLAVKTDDYIVWSQWMQDEMKDYYPEIPQENVLLLGTPQFEFYLDKSRVWSRKEFAEKYGLDNRKKWICFSGDDVTTSPYDQDFLNDVAESLYSKRDQVQIIFRRCPVDFSKRYDEVLDKYSNFIVSIDPLWNIEAETGWTGYFPKYQDINMQINLAYHCEVVVNLGSTMALDFATCNKPCLYLNYNPSADASWSTEKIYNFQHFRSMQTLKPVGWINKKDSILEQVMRVLDSPEDIVPDIQLWKEKLVLHPLNKNSEKIAKAIL
ncbi:MAG: Rdx family protein [Winogradskyella sp.]|nr:Rdx family protein [Winogradskyella sp.]